MTSLVHAKGNYATVEHQGIHNEARLTMCGAVFVLDVRGDDTEQHLVFVSVAQSDVRFITCEACRRSVTDPNWFDRERPQRDPAHEVHRG